SASTGAGFRPLVPDPRRARGEAAERSRLRVALQAAEVLVADLDRFLVRSGTEDDPLRFGQGGVGDHRQPEQGTERRLRAGLAASEEAFEVRFVQQPHRGNTEDLGEALLVHYLRGRQNGDPDLVAA